MAIKGMGIDIIEISRLSDAISRFGGKFIDKIYTPAEAGLCRAHPSRSAASFAGRWAAKEAFYKALPANLQPFSSWQSIQILVDAAGRPCIDVCDGRLRSMLFDDGLITSIHLSISHEKTHCVAVVVLD